VAAPAGHVVFCLDVKEVKQVVSLIKGFFSGL